MRHSQQKYFTLIWRVPFLIFMVHFLFSRCVACRRPGVRLSVWEGVPICDTLTFCPIGHPSSYIDGDRCCTFSLCCPVPLSVTSTSSLVVYKLMRYMRSTNWSDGRVKTTSSPKDSSDATPPACHCDHNKCRLHSNERIHPFSVTLTLELIALHISWFHICQNSSESI